MALFSSVIATSLSHQNFFCEHKKNGSSSNLSRNFSRNRRYGQYYLDLGQSDFMLYACSLCGLMYAGAVEEDEQVQRKFHQDYKRGIRFKGWHNERVVSGSWTNGNRILLILDTDPSTHKRLEECAFSPPTTADWHLLPVIQTADQSLFTEQMMFEFLKNWKMSSKFSENFERVLCRFELPSLLLSSRQLHSCRRQFFRYPRWADSLDKCEFFRRPGSPADLIVDSDRDSTVSQPDNVARGSTVSKQDNVAVTCFFFCILK